jgi:hypothetical protein
VAVCKTVRASAAAVRSGPGCSAGVCRARWIRCRRSLFLAAQDRPDRRAVLFSSPDAAKSP